MNLRDDLHRQLVNKGLADPTAARGSNIEELSPEAAGHVSGGFAQVVGFEQRFAETVGGGYRQTTFLQTIPHPEPQTVGG